MFGPALQSAAEQVLGAAKKAGVRIVTVETCTAGLVSACLTSVPGASEIFERGFILYHASAKASGLGVADELAALHGAVSAEVTAALAQAALRHSQAGISVAVTGYAGPGGGTEKNPVGTVYIAVALVDKMPRVERHRLPGDRDAIRLAAVHAALLLMAGQLSIAPTTPGGEPVTR